MRNDIIRLLPDWHADGPTQMAADEVLLQAAQRGLPSLRFYTWSEPTLSLGYFQPSGERWNDPNLHQLPWVRRSTGGKALVHDRELTYSLALPAGQPWQTKETSWLCRMHHILVKALADHQIAARTCLCGEQQQLGPFLCFLDQTPADVLMDTPTRPAKIAGSAQRKQRGALLQHGGILLQQSPFTPALPGIAELTQRHLTKDELKASLLHHFQLETGWIVELGDWTDQEREAIERIAAEKYRGSDWNEKR